MCQGENENEPESFPSFWIRPVTSEPGPQYYDTLKDRFVLHALAPELTKALVFVFAFVFVLAHEQAIRKEIASVSIRASTLYTIGFWQSVV